ncbi:unnamed protein product [Bursaphelenchus okinawaensis]|uniref:Tr-type G domain-containing protein n=1 Tax=Bursaphelenchus okinawaensis TaxID=465554 RepID=A0A811JT93_9BILA|nr:unnamed protein product [Bursaphelenchus okinawaensis]CAG9081453.1 unnamed protein product [Bursaphelenchus okinawaensis]
MSRHRFVKNINIEDELLEDEDRDYYGKSFEDEVPMSPSTSQFIYHRSRVSSQCQSEKPIVEEEDDYSDDYGDDDDMFGMDDVSFKPKNNKNVKKPAPKPVAQQKVQQPRVVHTSPPQKKPALPAVENLKISTQKTTREASKSPLRMTPNASAQKLNVLDVALGTQPVYKPRERPASDMDTISLVIAGHVDAGKSTLVGHSLYLLGNVDEKSMRGYKQQSLRSGKASFAFAWILDETEEERIRGVTMDIAHANFNTPHRRFNILDAPGHKDFIPNMITGAAQADAALLVVNASKGEFETGFDLGGQTREHALLLRSLGVQQIVVALNKMDAVDWSEERFKEIKEVLNLFLKKNAGFNNIQFVPLSAFDGVNLNNKPAPDHPLMAWYKGDCLVEVLDHLNPPPRAEDKPMRVIINDVYKSTGNSVVLQGKIESGFVDAGAKVYIMPNCEQATVKSINSSDKGADHQQYTSISDVCFAGENVLVTLAGTFEPDSVTPGMIICRGGSELLIPAKFLVVKLVLFENALPLLKGSKAELHSHALRVPCTVLKLKSIVNKQTGEVIKLNPRVITKGMSAVIDLVMEHPVCVEPFAKSKTLGRVSLRVNGRTIAAGLVDQVSR